MSADVIDLELERRRRALTAAVRVVAALAIAAALFLFWLFHHRAVDFLADVVTGALAER